MYRGHTGRPVGRLAIVDVGWFWLSLVLFTGTERSKTEIAPPAGKREVRDRARPDSDGHFYISPKLGGRCIQQPNSQEFGGSDQIPVNIPGASQRQLAMLPVSSPPCRSLLAGDFRTVRVAHRLQAGSYLRPSRSKLQGIAPLANEFGGIVPRPRLHRPAIPATLPE